MAASRQSTMHAGMHAHARAIVLFDLRLGPPPADAATILPNRPNTPVAASKPPATINQPANASQTDSLHTEQPLNNPTNKSLNNPTNKSLDKPLDKRRNVHAGADRLSTILSSIPTSDIESQSASDATLAAANTPTAKHTSAAENTSAAGNEVATGRESAAWRETAAGRESAAVERGMEAQRSGQRVHGQRASSAVVGSASTASTGAASTGVVSTEEGSKRSKYRESHGVWCALYHCHAEVSWIFFLSVPTSRKFQTVDVNI